MNREQRRLASEYYDHSLWEFMPGGEILTPQEFIEAWDRNIKHLRDIADETDTMFNRYRNRHVK